MDKLEELKCLIIAKYDIAMLKFSKGYPVKGYNVLLEAIKAVDDVQCYDFTTIKRDIIINHHLIKLKKDGE